ncbi:AC5 [West African Asystasia virus 1]|uniref:AC5 n=1 Tax=West African Asystasia virus 1 TaxID=1046573 RepID=A0A190D9H7_9GEMI|nr:AC5 [West African Asystasia virus 1]ALQ10822.1 AC5 [West African Asystasia virus 1]
MFNIITLIKRLHLTRTFTTSGNITTGILPVQSWFPIHGPVRPYSPSGDADIWYTGTRAVEVQAATYLGCGGRDHNICWTL